MKINTPRINVKILYGDTPSIRYHYITAGGISSGYSSLDMLKTNIFICNILGIIKVETYKSGELNIEVLDDD